MRSKIINKKSLKYVYGIDEVGRGPIAGPVCVGIVKISLKKYPKIRKILKSKNIRDSKKLTEKQRLEWLEIIKKLKEEKVLDFALTFISANKIDKLGIASAIKICVKKNLQKLSASPNDKILLDGSLFAPTEYKNQKTIIKGDEKEPVISLASIVAKVNRDNLMTEISSKYPNYNFKNHKGYGTTDHILAIKKYGITKIHRKSFCRKIIDLHYL